MNVLNVVGARPNFMKMAPLVRALQRRGIRQCLVHTGQHYDENMSRVFFDELGMPEPDVYLQVGSGSHAVQTAEVMVRIEPVMLEQRPDLVVVVGDVNSTVAATLVAAKLQIPVAHVEAGLRSFDRTMPEEINRIVTDQLAELLLTPSPDGDANLSKEGIPSERIHRVGNVMIDSLVQHLERARASDVLERLKLQPASYSVLTLHRPANVDVDQKLLGIMEVVHDYATRQPVIFACHPRTAARLDALNGYTALSGQGDLRRIPPLGYLDFLALTSNSQRVITDSGGLQEETSYLGIPCVTLRDNTERPITIEQGTNILAGTDPLAVRGALKRSEAQPERPPQNIEHWDGKTAERIVDVFESWARSRGRSRATPDRVAQAKISTREP